MATEDNKRYHSAIMSKKYYQVHLGLICSRLCRTYHFDQLSDTIPLGLLQIMLHQIDGLFIDPNQQAGFYQGITELLTDCHEEIQYQRSELRRKRGM